MTKVQKLFDEKENKILLKSTESHAIPIWGIDTTQLFTEKKYYFHSIKENLVKHRFPTMSYEYSVYCKYTNLIL